MPIMQRMGREVFSIFSIQRGMKEGGPLSRDQGLSAKGCWEEGRRGGPGRTPVSPILSLLRGSSMGWGGSSPFIAKAPRVSTALSPSQPPSPLLLLIQMPQDPIASKRNRGFRPSATALSIPPEARPRGHLPSHASAGNFKPRT